MSERSIISVAIVGGVLGYLAVTAVDPANKTLGGVRILGTGAATYVADAGDREESISPPPRHDRRADGEHGYGGVAPPSGQDIPPSVGRGGKEPRYETAQEHEQHRRECVANGYKGPRCYWMKAPDGKPW